MGGFTNARLDQEPMVDDDDLPLASTRIYDDDGNEKKRSRTEGGRGFFSWLFGDASAEPKTESNTKKITDAEIAAAIYGPGPADSPATRKRSRSADAVAEGISPLPKSALAGDSPVPRIPPTETEDDEKPVRQSTAASKSAAKSGSRAGSNASVATPKKAASKPTKSATPKKSASTKASSRSSSKKAPSASPKKQPSKSKSASKKAPSASPKKQPSKSKSASKKAPSVSPKKQASKSKSLPRAKSVSKGKK